MICVQTALQASGRCLEWESLLFPRQGKFWEACRLLCTCWTPMSTVEEMVLSGEAGCCSPQERECGCRQARWGVLRSLFSPRRASRGPRVRWGGLAETGRSINLDQKDCFSQLFLKKKKNANFPLLFSVRSSSCHLHYKLSSKPKLDKSE